MAFSTHDIVPDSPTNNFCTLNPLIGLASTLSDGNLYSTISGVNHGAIPNFALPLSGIWYTEFKFHSIPSGYPAVGLSVNNKIGWNTAGSETDPQSLTYNGSGGTYNFEEYGTAFSFSNEVDNINAVINTTNVYALYWNADTNKLTLYDGTNTASVDVTVNTTEPISFIYAQSAGATYTVSVNFGQDPTFGGAKSPTTTYTDANGIGAFYYQPPTGAKALCTANLPDFTPTVAGDVPQDYFKAVKYTGQTTADAGTWDSGNNILSVAVGFQPDLVWTKPRGSGFNIVRDSVRGSTYRLITDGTYAELSDSDYGTFSSTGFNLGPQANANSNNVNHIAWCFRAGGPPDLTSSPTKPFAKDGVQYETLSAANITAGTITPTAMSVNTDAGFSIIKFNGINSTGTLPHGFSKEPEFVIFKKTSATSNWIVHRNGYAARKFLYLNNSNGLSDAGADMVTNYSNSVLSLGTDGDVNPSDGASMITYCWHSVEGYSKFGSYTGNGSTDGPFVYCGFRPAFVIIKCSSDTTTTHTSWAMYDNARDSSNVMNKVLYANKSINEGYRGDASTAATDIYIDFLSNGFKVRSTKEEVNDANETYIFMAFAEQPFKFSNAR